MCTFFLFFFNIFLGVVSCLKRILIGAVLGVMFLGRTQKSVISRDFELMDPGMSTIFFFYEGKKLLYIILGQGLAIFNFVLINFTLGTDH